jgi:hypothetical protein
MARVLSLSLGFGLCLSLFTACGDGAASSNGDNSSPTQPAASTASPTTSAVSPNDPGPAPALDGPASKYSISQLDLDSGYLTDIPGTFVLDALNYGQTKTFATPEEGQRLLSEWGYAGGYETGYTPEGRERAVLQGAYYFWVETHLFEDQAGAAAAYDYFDGRLRASGSEAVTFPGIGNESSAWVRLGEKVYGSSVDSAFHRIVFRRGNLVSIVATWGAEPFMNVGIAASLGAIVDEKALGERDTPEPTPTSNFTPESVTTPTEGN